MTSTKKQNPTKALDQVGQMEFPDPTFGVGNIMSDNFGSDEPDGKVRTITISF